FIGSFSIIAGGPLLANLFAMLAAERKAGVGMPRGVGRKRGRRGRSCGVGGGGGLALALRVPRITIADGVAMGFLIAFVTVASTSIRISRINIIAAIRALPNEGGRRPQGPWGGASP